MVSRYFRIVGLVCLVFSVGAAGCSRGPAMAKISGEVTMDGQPLKEGRILFTPEDGQGQTGGSTITDGKFLVEVPPAKMKVQINANQVIGKQPAYEGAPNSPMIDIVKEIIPKRYNDQTELKEDVKPGAQSVKYELRSK
jgi:hypothetical protein